LIDLHTHSFLSDGVLIPSELVRRAQAVGYEAIAITDHVDFSNYASVIEATLKVKESFRESPITVIAGVEITHVPPEQIPRLIELCRREGAELVVVHGETLVEPVAPKTNRAAIEGGADILAHPGLIDRQEVKLAAERGVYLEITARKGHNITNGYVARVAREEGASLVINTDAHSPGDLMAKSFAVKVGLGAGLSLEEVNGCFSNSLKIVERLTGRG